MKSCVKVLSIIALSLLLLIIGPGSSFAANNENNNIPQDVLDKIQQKVQENAAEEIEVEAWEEDLNGNKVKVTPLSERKEFNEKKSGEIEMYAVPNDGYNYVADMYLVNNPSRNWRYKSAGVFRINNTSYSIPMYDVTYVQQSAVENFWSVGATISGSGTFGNSFLGQIAYSVGGSYDKSRKYTTGTTFSTKIDVDPRTIAYLANYTVGMYDKGTLRYKKYTTSGSLVGYYSESGGGTAVSKSDINLELSDTDPM